MSTWQLISTAPRDRYILVSAPSGYGSTPLRVGVCKWDDSPGGMTGWRTYAWDWFTDEGEDAIYWMELPIIP